MLKRIVIRSMSSKTIFLMRRLSNSFSSCSISKFSSRFKLGAVQTKILQPFNKSGCKSEKNQNFFNGSSLIDLPQYDLCNVHQSHRRPDRGIRSRIYDIISPPRKLSMMMRTRLQPPGQHWRKEVQWTHERYCKWPVETTSFCLQFDDS